MKSIKIKTKINKKNIKSKEILINKASRVPMIEFPTSQVNIKSPSIAIICLVFISIFVFYIYNLMPNVPGGDSAELITSAYLLGIPHPPGYPLFNLLGKLFSFIPIGSVAWRVNLSSSVYNLGASIFIYLSLQKLTKYWPAALFASLFFSLSPMILEFSLKAEVFPLNNLFAALIIYLIITSREYYVQYELNVLDENTYLNKSRTMFYLILFVCGLALTNHHTIILLAPGVLIALYSYNKSALFKLKPLSIGLGLFALGLSVYLYIPIRAHAQPYLNWDNPQTLHDFIRLVTRADYGSFNLMSTTEMTYETIENHHD